MFRHLDHMLIDWVFAPISNWVNANLKRDATWLAALSLHIALVGQVACLAALSERGVNGVTIANVVITIPVLAWIVRTLARVHAIRHAGVVTPANDCPPPRGHLVRLGWLSIAVVTAVIVAPALTNAGDHVVGMSDVAQIPAWIGLSIGAYFAACAGVPAR